MSAPRAWLLNLEVEQELAHGPGYVPSAAVLQRIANFLPSAQPLLNPADVRVLSSDSSTLQLPEAMYQHAGRCWCPTPAALRMLQRQRIPCPPSPTFEVLRRVNHRRFCLEMGGGAPGAHFVETEAQLESLSERLASRPWLLKRPYGTAGREQRQIGGGQLLPEDRKWLVASLRKGGMVAEHWVTVEDEYALHGLLSPAGQLTLGDICGQQVSAHRAWQQTLCPAPVALCDTHAQELIKRATQVGTTLHRAGYFGPFGIDAYTYRRPYGSLLFNSLSELNARYSMGFATGFAGIDGWRELPGA